MGKGDIKTKRGKIANSSFGKLRPHHVVTKPEEVPAKVKKPSKTKKASK